ncbi:HNH endonuclease [Carboxydothermus ferrireducens]|uniref:5-methylcytosine-specific restriction protein A n=1 Tax=Carboxydothermus ferrireducens DSM 11255 TaxID=1119529 RepID=A0ABX2RAS7_9THEO|nr:HNH endonuclease [Carboxydothermus ferrireducens]NYE57178.1 5-methylcytosine-specific restriction protein A [Carboxydothermus ferrireducens DSM 11255]
MKKINTWENEELILALDLYFRNNPNKLSNNHPEIKKLANILNQLPINKKKNISRTPNSVYMKLCNFLRLDPNYPGKGLANGGKLDEKIWNEYSNNIDYLRSIAQTIIDSLQDQNIMIKIESMEEIDAEEEFPEGKILYKLHKYYERSYTLVKRLKEDALKNGALKCWVCGFDFFEKYGDLGKGFIEVHHTVPISEYRGKRNTKLADLVLVCSNCHRMLHRKRPWLKIDELKKILK